VLQTSSLDDPDSEGTAVKITEVVAHPLSVEIDEPSWTAHEFKQRAELVLVEVRTDEGLTGYGEIQSGPMTEVCRLVERFGEVVEGMDPRGHVAVWERLMKTTSPRPGGIGGWDDLPPPLPRGQRPQAMAALGGIDIALWDIKGKAADMPVFRLLGGTDTEVFTYATGGYYTEEKTAADDATELAGFVADGYDAVKLKTGALSLDAEVERVRRVREAIGEDVLLMLDMNATYDVDGCIRFAAAVEPYDVFWLEEPLHWYLQPADFARLAAATSIPLAHGEREWHRFTIREFIDSGAIRYVQFDSTRYGGFTESLRIAHYAEQNRVVVAPHTAPHVHAHLVSAFGEHAFAAESHGSHVRNPIQPAIYRGGPTVEDGRVHLTDDPGFGYTVDRDGVEECRA
jgi:D-galactarolactone cycloisomerase